MTPDEILRQLQHVPDKADFAPYEAALRAAIDQREAVTPELIATLGRVSADPAHYLKHEEECLHLFAIYLLAQFREPRALEAFIRFFSLPGEDALNLTGDMVTEQGAAILASVCGGDPAPLRRLAQCEAVNEFVRGQAIDGLLVQSLWGERPREAVIDDLRNLFSTLPKPGNGCIWACLVSAVCDFQAPELLPQARQSFAEELVDESIIGLDDVQHILLKTGHHSYHNGDQRLEIFRDRNAPIDAVAECSSWLCFREEDDSHDGFRPGTGAGDIEIGNNASARVLASGDKPYLSPPKVGRNDPCPCGSGKKYKKCCTK